MVIHVSPTNPTRCATAPYNFVPLPKKVFTVEEGVEVNGQKIKLWEMQSAFVRGTRSGWIDLRITTLTPLFIRGPKRRTDGTWDDRDSRLRPEPFTSDGTPMIAGSSIRGMIRTLVEILSFSSITPVTNEKPFFRSVGRDRIGIAYRNRMVRAGRKPEAGYVRRNGNRWTIVPAKEVLRIHRNLLNDLHLGIPAKPNPRYFPDWNGQHKPCWFKRNSKKSDEVEKLSFRKESGLEDGILVLTGSAPNKKYDFIFVGRDETKPISIPDGIWRRIHDDDQITRWQEKAFPKDKPSMGYRKQKGHLCDGEPVFYLTDTSAATDNNPDGLVFLGRAQMFRFPYDLSPRDLVPEDIKAAGLDMASAVFGIVAQNGSSDAKAVKSRVFFENAVADSGGPEWFERIMVPKTLSSPKPSCFQQYLTQDGTKSNEDLTTYLKGDYTTIRGHKLYWHRWNDSQSIDAVKEQKDHDGLLNDLLSPNPKDTQHTIMTPIKSGVTFKGRIRFEGLADIELGALLWALNLPEGCAHRLGMGKSLGLGSIRIDSKLRLVDRSARYGSWQESGITEAKEIDFMRAFEKAILEHARKTEGTVEESEKGLFGITRLQSLFCLLDWAGKPDSSKTDYMELKCFKSRPVLPTPHAVMEKDDPPGEKDLPRPAAREDDSTNTVSNKPSVVKTQPSPLQAKPVEKGQTRKGKLKRTDGCWVAIFEGDSRAAVIVNPSSIPAECADDCKAEFYITEQSKRTGIKVRFEKLM